MIEILERIKEVVTSTTFVTVLSGVLVYLISQWILECYINPRKKYKELRGRIIYTITLYCCYYHSPYNLLNEKGNVIERKVYDEGKMEIRKIGAELAGYIGTIPKRKKDDIERLEEVKANLIALSNGFFMNSEKFDTLSANIGSERIIKKNLNFE